MNKSTKEIALSLFRKHHGRMRTQQALSSGISPRTLYALRDAGEIIQESRGLFRLADKEPSSYSDLVQVAIKVPAGVVCLISALDFYGITTQIPHYVYLALPSNIGKPRFKHPPLRVFWLSDKAYQAGITEEILEGIPVKIYSVEKTIVDCFKFRNTIGIDIAVEALKQSMREQKCRLDYLQRYARINRVERLITPYLEVLL
ncbi:MAG: transcriptional regulator [Anaerolineae bacterium]|jgi:predicted transcriptional regulator of viral defense system|nr:transcriptional regulator [Anaerolineae bacterium]